MKVQQVLLLREPSQGCLIERSPLRTEEYRNHRFRRHCFRNRFFPEQVQCSKNRLRLQQHSWTTPVGAIIHRAVTILSETPQVGYPDLEASSVSSPLHHSTF